MKLIKKASLFRRFTKHSSPSYLIFLGFSLLICLSIMVFLLKAIFSSNDIVKNNIFALNIFRIIISFTLILSSIFCILLIRDFILYIKYINIIEMIDIKYEHEKKYNSIYSHFDEVISLQYIDVLDYFIKYIHPNIQGDEKKYQEAWESFKENYQNLAEQNNDIQLLDLYQSISMQFKFLNNELYISIFSNLSKIFNNQISIYLMLSEINDLFIEKMFMNNEKILSILKNKYNDDENHKIKENARKEILIERFEKNIFLNKDIFNDLKKEITFINILHRLYKKDSKENNLDLQGFHEFVLKNCGIDLNKIHIDLNGDFKKELIIDEGYYQEISFKQKILNLFN